MIVPQQSAEPLPALHGVPGVEIRRRRPSNEPITEPLVLALEIVVFDILRDHVAQMTFAKRSDSVEKPRANRVH